MTKPTNPILWNVLFVHIVKRPIRGREVAGSIPDGAEAKRSDKRTTLQYSQTCFKRQYETRHMFGFSDRWSFIAA